MIDLDLYKRLFIHRTDVFAEQQESGNYYPVRRPITDDDIAEHLEGFASYGTYVIEPAPAWNPDLPTEWAQIAVSNTVKYIVFDLDTHDEAALEHLIKCCERFALSAHLDDPDARDSLLLERSGNKGWHVWMFLSAPVPARQVRAWIARDFPWEVSTPLEVFPKQDTVDEGGFGNLVKLPLGVHAVSGKKSEIVSVQGWPSVLEEIVPLDAGLVPAIAGPVTDGVVFHPTSSGVGQAALVPPSGRPAPGQGGSPSTPFPCIDLALYGPVGQGYRDRMIHRLALYLFSHGMAEDLAEEQCLRANENYDPPLPERDVRMKVRSAYRGRQRGAGCNTQDWLQDICPGPCDRVQVSGSAGALHRAQTGGSITVDVAERQYTEGKVRLKLSHPDADNKPTLIVSPNER